MTSLNFSSRGPVIIDGSNRIKPDISAPGTNIRSSYNSSDSAYVILAARPWRLHISLAP